MAVRLVEARGDIDSDDWVTRAADLPDVPTYLVHSAGEWSIDPIGVETNMRAWFLAEVD